MVTTKPSEVVSQKTQPSSFSRVWFPTPSERSNERDPTLLHGFCQTRSIRAADFDKITSINKCRVQHSLNFFERPDRRPDKFFTSPLPSSEQFSALLSSFPSVGCSRQRGANDELLGRTEVMVASTFLCALASPTR